MQGPFRSKDDCAINLDTILQNLIRSIPKMNSYIKKLFLFATLLLSATSCAPTAAGIQTPTPPALVTSTRPAPVVEKNSGATPVTAAVVPNAEGQQDEGNGGAISTAAPTVAPSPVPSPTPLGPQDINGIPLNIIAPMNPETAANVAAIYSRGRELGRDPNAFSKLGDSTLLNPHFMGPFDEGDYKLGDFAYLQPTIDRWRGSFERHGVGARHGLHSWTVFDPMWADEKWCESGENLLACELRLQNPSVIFIRLGSNDSGSPSGFRYNVKEVIEFATENGVIPIIGTKADRFEGSNENNDILRALADEYDVPLWDFDHLAETLPNHGLDTDNIHLVIDELPHDFTVAETFQRGHAMQDLSALIALDQVRRIIDAEELQ